MDIIMMEGFETLDNTPGSANYYESGMYTYYTLNGVNGFVPMGYRTTTTNARSSGHSPITERCAYSDSGMSPVQLIGGLAGKNAWHVGGAWRFDAAGISQQPLMLLEVDGYWVSIYFAVAGTGDLANYYKLGVGIGGITTWQSVTNYLPIQIWNHLEITKRNNDADPTYWDIKIYLNGEVSPILDIVFHPSYVGFAQQLVNWGMWPNIFLDDIFFAGATDNTLKTPRYGPCYVLARAPSGDNLNTSTPLVDKIGSDIGVGNINELDGLYGDVTYRRGTLNSEYDEWDVSIFGISGGTIHAVQTFLYGGRSSSTTTCYIVPFVKRDNQNRKNGVVTPSTNTTSWRYIFDIHTLQESGQPWVGSDLETLTGGYQLVT